MTYDFSNHTLHRTGFESWELREWFTDKDGERYTGTIGLVMLTFARRGVIGITGDVCPGRNGIWSTPRYGLDWFSAYYPERPEGQRGKSPGYLAEKFLETGFHPERMAGDLAYQVEQLEEELEDLLKDPTMHKGAKRFGRLATDIEMAQKRIATFKGVDFASAYEPRQRYREVLEELDLEANEGFADVGWGYNPSDQALLSAIQVAFGRLYHTSVWKLDWDPYKVAAKGCAPWLPKSLALAVVEPALVEPDDDNIHVLLVLEAS